MSKKGQFLPGAARPESLVGEPRPVPRLKRLPRPVFARPESLASGSWSAFHVHPWAQFSYAISGVLEVRTPQGSHIVPPQRAVWAPPNMEHSLGAHGPALMRSLYIDSRAAPWVAGVPWRVLEVTPLARELILAVCALPADYPGDGPQARLVSVLLDQLERLPEARLTLPFPAESRLVRICNEMRAHPDDPRTLNEIASDAGMAGRTLTRLFERETGLTFGQWRLSLRLLLSLTALERGQSVTAVALATGYESPSAFIAAFKRHFGRTPGEFFQETAFGRDAKP